MFALSENFFGSLCTSAFQHTKKEDAMNKLRVLTTTLLLFFAVTLPARAAINESFPANYDSNGDSIAGWNWLRSSGNYAEWAFAPISGRNIVLCFSTLSTNTVNGGAGFDSQLKVSVNGHPAGMVMLRNDCACVRYPSNSRGICYQSHGCLRVKLASGESLQTVRVIYTGRNHSASRKESLKVVTFN